MSQIPLMLLSDAPSSISGLGRITRELCIRIAANLPDKFRLATLGYGGIGSKDLPWQQYTMCGDPPARGWFVPELYQAWNEWSQGEYGVLMTIWDASRMSWLTNPDACPDAAIRAWLLKRPFELWGYWPVDACGVNANLPNSYAEVMRKYDRNLAYSEWARGLMRKDGIDAEALPHGIDTAVWYPRDRKIARKKLQGLGMNRLGDNSLLVGIVATNQVRKDWALAFQTCAELLKQGQDVLMWCHTDTLHRHWDIVSLARDFGMLNRVMVTHPPVVDDDMAELYSACDVTLGIGLGEGFGYPIFESLACGVPCVHGNYGGAPEHMALPLVVEPTTWRLEGAFNCRRPVFEPYVWAHRVSENAGSTLMLPAAIDWNNLWTRWEAWFREEKNG